MTNRKKSPDIPEGSVMGEKINYEELRKLIALLEEKQLTAFELEVEGLKIKIGRGLPGVAPVALSEIPSPQHPSPSPSSEGADSSLLVHTHAPEYDPSWHLVTSPMVGTFYRAPDPTADPFVEIGDTVKKGQTLCIIEAMKLMNEIESDMDGTVVEVFVDNAKAVEYGHKLFALQPLT